MDNMLPEEKSLKDISLQTDIAIKDNSNLASFSRVNKLITALYMVTDIMERDEPMRTKLRTVGVEIISDTHNSKMLLLRRIPEILSYLEIATTINIISEMNSNILRKEFNELIEGLNIEEKKPVVISELFTKIEGELPPASLYKGQGMKIGLQNGETLMSALREVSQKDKKRDAGFRESRRQKILNILKKNEGLSIKDIVLALKDGNGQSDLSEKTLQRELIAMMKEGVLYRTGSKRWSRYFVKQGF